MIRAAKPKDAAACAAVLRGWIAANPWFPNGAPGSASAQSMQSRIACDTVYIAEKEGETLGFIAFTPGYLDCLYLAPQAQSQGLGKALLGRAKAANPGGLALWVLAENRAAIRFYQREGFVETARGDGADNEEGLPDVRLEWGGEANG